MKRALLALAVIVLLLTTWWFSNSRVAQEAGAPDSVAVAEYDPSEDVLPPTRPTANESKDSVDNAVDVAESDAVSDSCAELYRRAETSNIQFRFAEGREDEAGCANMLRRIFGPRVPAIPGFSGFEIRDMGDLSPRERLANEADNPEWSRAMEGAILDEITTLLDFPITTLHASCRSSTCGLLFAYRTADHHGGNYNFFAQEVADELGFSGFFAGHSSGMDGNGFTFVYLGNWETRRPEDLSDRNIPSSFEEASRSKEAGAPLQ